MQSPSLRQLSERVEQLFGATSVVSTGSSDNAPEHLTCIRILGIPATFSVHTQDGMLPSGQYDVQIEGVPPGDYVYTDIVSLNEFMRLVAQFAGPIDTWPVQ